MEKVLLVIPAYNEEANILKVIKEIQKDFNEANVLVINDSSTDKTEEILINNNIEHINHCVNLGYSGAVQTGIKYAYYNDYNYVILFDGDGQHIAKYAKKLFLEALKGEVDIVLGSRFIEKTDYKHPAFRKIGTFIFSYITKLFVKRRIYDPTTGLQCLNRKVMKKYSSLGGYPEYPDANQIIEMINEGYKVAELPVLMRESNTGKSMHSGIIKPIKYMIEVLYSISFIPIKTKR